MTWELSNLKRTDNEGKHETPYGEMRVPHLDGNDAKHKHGHCEG